MLIRFREERGMAMITALLATMVLVSISVAAFQLSLRTINRSALDRKSDQALQAAQGAVNAYLSFLPSSIRICNNVGVAQTLSSAPRVTYTISSVHWSTDGATWSNLTDLSGTNGVCTTSSTQKFAKLKKGSRLVVTGKGTAGSGAQVVTRTWQTLVDITPVTGGTTSAFYGSSGLCVNNNPNVMHNVTGNDAGLYSGGDINTPAVCGATNGNANLLVEGNIYAQGSVVLKGCVDGNIWAGGSVTYNGGDVGACTQNSYPLYQTITENAPPNPICDGTAQNLCYFRDSSGNNLGSITAGGNISLSSTAAYGSCVASGLVSFSSSRCSASRDSSGFAPAACAGTIGDGTTGCGTAHAAGLTPPPATDMPVFTYLNTDWTPVYAERLEVSGTCSTIAADIQDKITNGVGGNYNIVFYISTVCPNLAIPMNTTYNLKGNVAIVTRGSYSSSNLTVTTQAGYCNTNLQDNAGNPMYPYGKCLFDVIVPTDTVPGATGTCQSTTTVPGPWDISYGNQTDLSGVDAFNFTPCWLNLGQSAQFNGQGIAGVVNEANSFIMVFHKLVIPGFIPAGYNAAPVFFRECGSADTSGYC